MGSNCTRAPASEAGYAVLVAGDCIIRAARPSDARAIAEVSVASRRWSYRDLLVEAELAALSVEATTADSQKGLPSSVLTLRSSLRS